MLVRSPSFISGKLPWYGRENVFAKDLILGPNRFERWACFHPIVAEFVSDDLSRIEARKGQILEAVWKRATLLGEAYLRANPGVVRDGRPMYSMMPALPKP